SQRRQCQPIRRDFRRRRQRLRRRTECWRVCYGAAKNTEHRSRIEVRKPADEWRRQCAEDDNRGGNQIHFYALLPTCSEKAGSKLESNRENKQDQSEFLHKIKGAMIDLFTEVPDENPCEKYSSCSKANAAKLEAANSHANNADEGKEADCVCD